MKFNECEWHDAILKSVSIDRTNPGWNDIISMNVIWPDGASSVVVFEGVYKAIMDLNFGAVGNDYIVEAMIASNNDEDLLILKKAWKQAYIGDINCYILKTSATGSTMKIFAKYFKAQ